MPHDDAFDILQHSIVIIC